MHLPLWQPLPCCKGVMTMKSTCMRIPAIWYEAGVMFGKLNWTAWLEANGLMKSSNVDGTVDGPASEEIQSCLPQFLTLEASCWCKISIVFRGAKDQRSLLVRLMAPERMLLTFTKPPPNLHTPLPASH